MRAINLKDVTPAIHNPKANFDLSFNRKFCMKFGELFPILMQPTIPGDRFRLSAEHVVRFAPFISQVYQNYYISYDYYFVPNRLLWPAFENYMKGVGEHVHPYVDPYTLRTDYDADELITTLFDALDIPQAYILNARNSSLNYISAFPFGAYIRCILDYHIGTDTPLSGLLEELISSGKMFDDGDVTKQLVQLYAKVMSGNPNSNVPDGASLANVFQLCSRLYPLDYFTHARSNPQLGPAMTIPVELVSTDSDGSKSFKFTTAPIGTSSNPLIVQYTDGQQLVKISPQSAPSAGIVVNGSVLNNVATINDFYSAARVQELVSLYGFSGFTSQDALAAEFNVRNKDERVHKAEFIYHDTVNMSIGEVFSNNVNVPAEDDGSFTDIAGVGTAVAKGNASTRGFDYFAPEYGYIVGLMSVYPEAAYFQGLPKHFSVLDRFDYPHPKLANLGMVDVKMKEVYCAPLSGDTYNDTFCYLPPYDYCKNNLNRVNGQLKTSLEYMSAARKMTSVPTFNDTFLRVLPSYNQLNRTFNVLSDSYFDQPVFCSVQQNIASHRQLPKFGLFGNHPTL